MKQRTFKKRWFFFLFIFLIFAFVYESTFSIRNHHVTIESEKIHDDITICQISDLHGYSFGKDNQSLIKAIAKEEPDLIVATGDMFTYGDSEGEKIALSLLDRLTEVAPVYYVNGEHDNRQVFFYHLKKAGIHVFNYEEEVIQIKNTYLHLFGTNNVFYTSTFDLHNEWESDLDPDHFNIMLAHIENFEKFSEFGIDLTLCGDTHGGQIRLPFVGAIYNGNDWFPELNGAYIKGLYEKDGDYLYVNSGLGSSPIPIRLFNHPEVAVIHLKPL